MAAQVEVFERRFDRNIIMISDFRCGSGLFCQFPIKSKSNNIQYNRTKSNKVENGHRLTQKIEIGHRLTEINKNGHRSTISVES